MATFTALDQITRALRLIGVLAEEETPSAVIAQDSLMALNQMIDSWNTERLMIYNTQDQVFTWPASQITRTIGPTGDFVGNRPVQIDDSTYFRDPGTNVSYGIKIINQHQYDGIPVKTVTSTYPQVMWINMEYPNVSMTIYPKPNRNLEWHIISVDELTQPVTIYDVLAVPPGYLRAFTFNLAMELAPEFGVEPSPQVQRIAMTSKRNLKRMNQDDGIMSMPFALIARKGRFNIYAGSQ